MTETLTESFCERCGTRYTFESARPRVRMKGVKVISRGLKNFVLSDGTSMDEAMAAARNETDRELTSHQLDAFHKTFNFCMSCRQYTCPNCWNEVEARCLTCAPHLGHEIMPAPFPNLDAAAGLGVMDPTATNGSNGNGVYPDADGDVDRAADVDIAARLDALTAAERPVESPFEEAVAAAEAAEAEAAVAAAEAAAAEAEAVAAAAAEAEAVAAAAAEAEAVAAAEAEAEAVAAAAAAAAAEAEAEAVAAAAAEAEAVAVAVAAAAAEAEAAVVAAAAVAAAEAEAAAAAEAEAAAAAEAEAEADIAARLADLAAAAIVTPAEGDRSVENKAAAQTSGLLRHFRPDQSLDAEISSRESERAAALATPTAADVATPEPEAPAVDDVVSQPTWQMVAPDPGVDARIAKPTDPASIPAAASAADPNAEPQWPTRPGWLGGRPAAGLPFLGRTPTPQGGLEALWAESAKEVVTTPTTPGKAIGGVQPCISCGLSLSASARFCRRCGTPQAS